MLHSLLSRSYYKIATPTRTQLSTETALQPPLPLSPHLSFLLLLLMPNEVSSSYLPSPELYFTPSRIATTFLRPYLGAQWGREDDTSPPRQGFAPLPSLSSPSTPPTCIMIPSPLPPETPPNLSFYPGLPGIFRAAREKKRVETFSLGLSPFWLHLPTLLIDFFSP